ncbi:RICIN domain-containing protein [Streptomyces sp. NPDC049906]|uniref:RICIN domain-containing protein n=1 Tax=Streptomyces sp. NPDC049906 TaxID=3155656 RepID=UPI003440283B
MSPAQRIATAAVIAALVGGAPGLAVAASPQTSPPSQQNETWVRYEVTPPNSNTRTMDVDSGGRLVMVDRAPNSDRQLWGLSGAEGQQLLKNKATGTCLTAPGGGSQGSVTLQTCDPSNVNQQWRAEYWGEGRYTLVLASHRDLYLTGSGEFGGGVSVEIYHGTFAQHWSAVPPGY